MMDHHHSATHPIPSRRHIVRLDLVAAVPRGGYWLLGMNSTASTATDCVQQVLVAFDTYT